MTNNQSYSQHSVGTILETANHIIMNSYTNASFSNMDVVFISKKLYETYLENLSKLKNEERNIQDIDKDWKVKTKQEVCEESVLNSVLHVKEGINDCIIYEKSNLVVMNKNYYAFLNEVFEYQT